MANGEARNTPTAVPIPPAEHINSELEHERQSAARILQQFAGALRKAAREGSIRDAAQYVHMHYWKDLAAGIGELVQKLPALSIVAAFTTGYVAGRLIRSR
jgi:hypothetical protein